jgi:hypothetical protein
MRETIQHYTETQNKVNHLHPYDPFLLQDVHLL